MFSEQVDADRTSVDEWLSCIIVGVLRVIEQIVSSSNWRRYGLLRAMQSSLRFLAP